MGRLKTIARRTFLIGSAAIAGGVAFGVYTVRKPIPNPLEDVVSDGEATFNPYIRISSDRICFVQPHVDIGQGAQHVQSLLMAEELDVDPTSADIEYPQPNPAYHNAAMAAEAGEIMSYITPFSAERMSSIMGAVGKVIGLQGTGGSTTVPDTFDKLRQAGASARETLKAAAALEWGLDVADLKTDNGKVIAPDGQELAYTALAARAATIDPVTDVPLRDPATWRYIGRPTMRRDVVPKSTGTQLYGIDLVLDGMVHAAARVNPRRGAMSGFDAGAARDMRGVSDVVELSNGVAVVADNTWRAFQAVNQIDVDWGPSAYPPEQSEHWDLLQAAVGNEDRLDGTWLDQGDVANAPGTRFEAEYRAPYVAHQPLEPLGAIALVTDDRIELWTSTQAGDMARGVVALVSGHDADQVVIHNQVAGGSFGHRLEFDHLKVAVEIANQMRGTPVKLTYTREEDFAQDYPRHIALAQGRGTVENGQITSIDIDVAAPSVIRSQTARANIPVPGPDSQIAAGIWSMPYRLNDVRLRGYAVDELAPTSSWRAVGASYGGFIIESFVDELIAEAGADPVEGRLHLIGDDTARGVLEAAASAAGWTGSDIGAGRGRGVAVVTSFGVPVAEVIDVTMTDYGLRIDDVWVAADPGIVIDPVNIENHIQGAVVWGLGHAINSEITYADGMAQQSNYHQAEGMRLYQTPRIHVTTLQNNPHIRGIGEPPVPPASPALANAIFAATGQRLREMPFNKFIDFV